MTPLRSRLAVASIVLIFCLAAACSSSDDNDPGGAADSSERQTTTTEPPDRPPEIRAPSEVRVEVGRLWSDAIVVTDPDGDEVTVQIPQSPPDLSPTVNRSGLITGFEWQPQTAGEWQFEIVATDTAGNVSRSDVQLVSRFPRDDDVFLAMGDSVAAGFGRDRSDFLGPDDCYRSEGASYPTLVFDALVEARSLSPTAEFLMVACSGVDAGDLETELVRATRRDGSTVSEEQTQLDWAIEQNPTIVSLTVGAHDIRFVDPREMFVDDAGDDATTAVDEPALTTALDDLRASLDDVLETILRTTDAHVAVTTYYDPTAVLPVGIDGCGAVCFKIASAEIAERLNDTISTVAAAQRPGRVSVVRIDDLFDRHEATNGFGPDIIRETDFGPFQGLVSRFTRDTFPYCSDGDGNDDTWVTRLDCTHPNDDGHAAIAAAMVQVLLEI